MLICRLCHAFIDFGICLGVGSLINGSQNTVWTLGLDDEIPENYENRSNSNQTFFEYTPGIILITV